VKGIIPQCSATSGEEGTEEEADEEGEAQMTPRVRKDVKDLLATLDSDTPKGKRTVVMAGALIGGMVGAGIGFALVLLVFGLLTEGAQSGLGAILFGAPLGAWAGAEIGARKAGRR
jgi:hypothetical protein